jgi:hypothetical protein
MHMTINIIPNNSGNPAGKLADVELLFNDMPDAFSARGGDGALAGFKLIGFSIWERRGNGGRNVTFPARQYTVNGERRSFALLRPMPEHGGMDAQERLRERILEAYAAFEQEQAVRR